MKRRDFLKLAAAGVPAFNIGSLLAAPLAKRIAQGGKIRVALIGCGAQMTGLIRRMGGEQNVQVVALVDPLPSGIRAVKASAKKFYGSFDFTGAWEGADYREMFEKVGDKIDAAFIATPNHHHAIPALMAIRRGIHVFVEKPLALTLEEVQLLAREAKKYGVVTQVGNYGHSTKAMKMCVDAVKNGVIGDVTEVYSYSDRVNSMFFRPPASEPPKGMDWDIWCGPAPVCEFYGPHEGRTGLHPHDWHSWIGYGNGSIGNMGTHIMDAPFWALDLGKTGPESVEAKDVAWGCRRVGLPRHDRLHLPRARQPAARDPPLVRRHPRRRTDRSEPHGALLQHPQEAFGPQLPACAPRVREEVQPGEGAARVHGERLHRYEGCDLALLPQLAPVLPEGNRQGLHQEQGWVSGERARDGVPERRARGA